MLPPLEQLLTFMAAGLALNVTPGPDMLYIAARSVADGKRAGIFSALGVGTGTLFHIAVVAFGVAGILMAVPVAFTIVRIAGAFYLLWIGVRYWRAADVDSVSVVPGQTVSTAFRQGVITNVLNPKVALFFLAFLPQFIEPARGNTALQVIALGVIFDVVGTLVNVAVAIGAASVASKLSANRPQQIIRRACGTLFIALGVRLAVASK